MILPPLFLALGVSVEKKVSFRRRQAEVGGSVVGSDDEDEVSAIQDLLNPIVEIEEDEEKCRDDGSDFSSRDFASPGSGRRNRMSAAERLESKRRRDREYRQRKRLLKSEAGIPEDVRKMGRRSKYATDEERLESKRKRDAEYRERQKSRCQCYKLFSFVTDDEA